METEPTTPPENEGAGEQGDGHEPGEGQEPQPADPNEGQGDDASDGE